jgi:hypothetical protein
LHAARTYEQVYAGLLSTQEDVRADRLSFQAYNTLMGLASS